MGLTEMGDLLAILDHLPTNYKILFAILLFLIPRLVQMVGGGKVLRRALDRVWSFLVEVLRNYQARKQQEVEDEGLTEAYTRTLVVESLSMFAKRLDRIENKLDLALGIIDTIDDDPKG